MGISGVPVPALGLYQAKVPVKSNSDRSQVSSKGAARFPRLVALVLLRALDFAFSAATSQQTTTSDMYCRPECVATVAETRKQESKIQRPPEGATHPRYTRNVDAFRPCRIDPEMAWFDQLPPGPTPQTHTHTHTHTQSQPRTSASQIPEMTYFPK
jgi:hypothetical protein